MRDFLICFIIYGHFSTVCPLSNYNFVNDMKSWYGANASCASKGETLAVVHDLESTELHMTLRNTELGKNARVWVSGKQVDLGWKWYTNMHGSENVIRASKLVLKKGCYHAQFIYGGKRMENLTAESCFKECNWEGTVGLYSTMCICERQLWNLTRQTNSLCSIVCDGNLHQTCGGIRTISVYQQSSRAIRWAISHPMQGDGCAYMRKTDNNNIIFWHSAKCETSMRFLCQFENNTVCGDKFRCVRPLRLMESWEGARSACARFKGSLATITIPITNVDDDVMSLTPGRYWVGLKRQYEWRWADGSFVYESGFRHDFSRRGRGDDLCASLTGNDRNYWLEKTPCKTTLPYLCQKVEPKKLEAIQSVKMQPTEVEFEVLQNVTIEGTTEELPEDDSDKVLLQTILFLGIGVASGIAFVLGVCIIIYFIRRCHKSRMATKSTSYRHTPRDNFGVFPSDEAQQQSDEIGNESPFRRTQRLLREASLGSGSEGYRSNSWKRVQNGGPREGRKIEKPVMGCEIRNIYPSTERNFKDTSKAIYQVRAQFHAGSPDDPENVDYAYSGSLDTRLRKPVNQESNDIKLAETYSLPPTSRKTSDIEGPIDLDTGDLYACVQKAMARLSEDNLDKIESRPDYMTC